ncbi:MAG: Selenoprotein and cysteine-containing s [Devosia sp.]|nr:Selenoprotein and cysteine-containing s [Devosia sp.]
MTRYRPATIHANLGPEFFDPVAAADFPETILRYRNQRWAERVGLDELSEAEWLAHFGRFVPLPGSFPEPLALRYHGHQFRSYNPDLGDGRGFLFAQLHDLQDGRLLDLATKGSGRTPWSRRGDGRLTLKGGVREVLATAMLEALGVDTSKSFSLIETGEELERGDEPSPTRSAVLVRLSHSHIRIGTFQRLAYQEDRELLGTLVEHTIANYMPDLAGNNAPAAAMLGRTVEKVARTGAGWIAAGFVHGVLNTDNINITGESFDYGPWRFLPRYDPNFTAAYFDETSLYSFGRQPETLAWNLTRLAECLVPVSEIPGLEAELNRFWPLFRRELAVAMLRRLGLASIGETEDAELVTAIFGFLSASELPYEQLFFDWRGGAASAERAARSPFAERYAVPEFQPIADALERFTPSASVNLDHPYFARQTPRTMLIEEMEALWTPIAVHDDWSPLEAALAEIEVMREAYAGDN